MAQALQFVRPLEYFPSLCEEPGLVPSILPEPPSMPSALLRMELLLKTTAVDLGALCEVIRGDIGMSVGIMQLSNSEGDLPTRLQDLVLYMGRDELRSWTRERALLGPSRRASRAAMAELTRRSRLVARAAEVIARFTEDVNSEEAYFGALLHDLGSLPEILGWHGVAGSGPDRVQTGLMLARGWALPEFVLDAIQPQRESTPISALGRVVSAALEWTEGVEQALHTGIDSHMDISWSRSLVERWLPSLTAAEADSMFEYLDSCIEPWQARH